jgi:hypothetical protein
MWAGIRSYRMERKFPALLTDDQLAAITVPALLVTGARSALITPAQARDRASHLPNAQLAIVPGSHGGFNRLDALNARVVAFLSHCSGSGSWNPDSRPGADVALTARIVPCADRTGPIVASEARSSLSPASTWKRGCWRSGASASGGLPGLAVLRRVAGGASSGAGLVSVRAGHDPGEQPGQGSSLAGRERREQLVVRGVDEQVQLLEC